MPYDRQSESLDTSVSGTVPWVIHEIFKYPGQSLALLERESPTMARDTKSRYNF